MSRVPARPASEGPRRDGSVEGGESLPATVVVGTQWGDEGTGKFTDLGASHPNGPGDRLASAILEGQFTDGDTVTVDAQRDELTVT